MINANDIEKIYNKLKNTTGGKNADYIPELLKVDPKLYAISIYTVDGESINVGDYTHEFAIESCSKVFTLALALEKFGIPYLKKHIGENKSQEAFNSICSVDRINNHTINSFDNGGAMATTSLLYTPTITKQKYIKEIVDNMSNFAGRQLHVNNKIYKSEILHDEHNLAIAYLLKSYNKFYGDIETCVDVYTRQCSVMVTSKDVAVMAATLANGGVNPKTKKRVIKANNVKYIVDHLVLNGLYNETGKWMSEVGIPAKSGVGGILLLVIPGVMGIGIISPPLNKFGNSFKGIKTASNIVNNFHLVHL
jgi:glutaminase